MTSTLDTIHICANDKSLVTLFLSGGAFLNPPQRLASSFDDASDSFFPSFPRARSYMFGPFPRLNFPSSTTYLTAV